MTRYQVIQRLQNSPLTGWLWRYWRHEETGCLTLLPLWHNPGKHWQRTTMRA